MQVSNVKSLQTHSYHWAGINKLSTQQASVVSFSNRTIKECIIIIIIIIMSQVGP